METELFCTDVGFTPLNDCNANPPFKKGIRSSVFVKTNTRNETEIEKAARNKIWTCYGLKIKDVIVYDGSTFTL